MKKTDAILDAVWAATFVRVLGATQHLHLDPTTTGSVIRQRVRLVEDLKVAAQTADIVVAALKDLP